MTNADKFKAIFGIDAAELRFESISEFAKWQHEDSVDQKSEELAISKELQPVRCGCGGEAVVKGNYGKFFVICLNCEMLSLRYCDTKEEAVKAWNRAMSQRTAEVKLISEVFAEDYISHNICGMCDNCGETVYDHEKYCSECGAKLDWSGND